MKDSLGNELTPGAFVAFYVGGTLVAGKFVGEAMDTNGAYGAAIKIFYPVADGVANGLLGLLTPPSAQ